MSFAVCRLSWISPAFGVLHFGSFGLSPKERMKCRDDLFRRISEVQFTPFGNDGTHKPPTAPFQVRPSCLLGFIGHYLKTEESSSTSAKFGNLPFPDGISCSTRRPMIFQTESVRPAILGVKSRSNPTFSGKANDSLESRGSKGPCSIDGGASDYNMTSFKGFIKSSLTSSRFLLPGWALGLIPHCTDIEFTSSWEFEIPKDWKCSPSTLQDALV